MMSELSDKYYDFVTPEVKVFVDGENIASQGISVSEVEVERIRDGASSFRLIIPEALDIELNPKHEDLFRFGSEIQIHLGYKDRFETVITGLITSLTYHFEEENFLDLEIEGYDYLFLMIKSKNFRSWNEMSISDIVSDVVQSYPFNDTEIEPTTIVFPQIRQESESDFVFLKKLSKKVGYEFFVTEEGKFVFRSLGLNLSPELTLTFGNELIFFKPTLDLSQVVNKVIVKGWDPESKQEIVGIASSGDEQNVESTGEKGTTVVQESLQIPVSYEIRIPVRTSEEAEELAKSILNELSLGYLKAKCTTVGLPDVKVGTVLKFQGLGEKFSRKYYVEKVVHSFGDNGFTTKFEVRGNSL